MKAANGGFASGQGVFASTQLRLQFIRPEVNQVCRTFADPLSVMDEIYHIKIWMGSGSDDGPGLVFFTCSLLKVSRQ